VRAKRAAVRLDPAAPAPAIADSDDDEGEDPTPVATHRPVLSLRHKAQPLSSVRRFKAGMARIAALQAAGPEPPSGLSLAPIEVMDLTLRSATLGRRKPGSLPVQAVYHAAMEDSW
jgi:hypothetical protein